MTESRPSLPQHESAGVRRCRGCFYILDGLSEPRCPECGRTFSFDNPATYTTRSLRFLRFRSRLWLYGRVAVALALAGVLGVWSFRSYQRYLDMGVYVAAERGDWAKVARRIKTGCNVHYCSPHGRVTPLHLAAEYDQKEIVRLLLEAGADPQARNNAGETPLHLAARAGHADVTLLLIKAGAQVDTGAIGFLRPLHFATREGHLDVVRVLTDSGSQLSDTVALPPLHLAAWNGHLEIAEFLLEREPLAVNEQAPSGGMPLHWAAYFGRPGAVDCLLAHGADIEAIGVVFVGRSSMKWLIAQGTPLHVAAYMGHADVVQRLLAAGADPGAMNRDDKTALDLARHEGHAEVVALLEPVTSRPADDTPVVHKHRDEPSNGETHD